MEAIRIEGVDHKLTDAERVDYLLNIISEFLNAPPGIDTRSLFVNAMEGGVTDQEFKDITLLVGNREIVIDRHWTVKDLRAAAEKNARIWRERSRKRLLTVILGAVVAIAFSSLWWWR